MPFSGSTPAWAARPSTSRTKSAIPLRAVVMAEQYDRPGTVAKADLQVVAGIGPSVPDGGHAELLLEEPGDLLRAGVAARLVQRRGLSHDQAFQGCEHGGPLGPLHQGVVHA